MSYARTYTLQQPAARRHGASSLPAAVAKLSEPLRGDVTTAAGSTPLHVYPDTARQPLSREEITCLAIAAKRAWDKVSAGCITDFPGRTKQERESNWRHEQVRLATDGRAHGLTTMMRADFRNVFGRLLDLAGLTEQAFRTLMRTGQTRGGSQREDLEQCDQWIFGILGRVKRHFATQGGDANGRADAWLHEIVKWKEQKHGKPWQQWEVKERTQLYWTLKNRFAAMMEVGSTANRNKSQRAGGSRKSDIGDRTSEILPGCEEDEKPF